MTVTHKSQYLMVNAAVLTASVIQLVRGYRPVIVAIAALTFFVVGNLTVFLAGSKQRAADRKCKHDYYAGL